MITTLSWLVGYLLDMSDMLGCEFIRVDQPALSAGWERLSGELTAISSAAADWTALSAEPHLMWRGLPDEGDLIKAIGELLTQHVTIDHSLPAHVTETLDRHAEAFRNQLGLDGDKAAALANVRGARTIEVIQRELRCAGLSFRDGMHDLEQAAARKIGL